jgi:hypothetical protein
VLREVTEYLAQRLAMTRPVLATREPLISLRRTLFGVIEACLQSQAGLRVPGNRAVPYIIICICFRSFHVLTRP